MCTNFDSHFYIKMYNANAFSSGERHLHPYSRPSLAACGYGDAGETSDVM
jgi:hypothetical protein